MTRALAPPGRLVVGLTPLAWAAPVAAALARIRAESARLDARLCVADRDKIVEAVATGSERATSHLTNIPENSGMSVGVLADFLGVTL